MPPALRNRIADAFTTRGRDSSHLRTNEIPDVAPIIGGADAAEYKYPWFTHVLYASYDEDFQYYCGGTVYNERTVITAAHCVEDDPDQK